MVVVVVAVVMCVCVCVCVCVCCVCVCVCVLCTSVCVCVCACAHVIGWALMEVFSVFIQRVVICWLDWGTYTYSFNLLYSMQFKKKIMYLKLDE